MQHRAIFLSLTAVLLLGRVACAWGWTADPCCNEERGRIAQVATLYDATTELPVESPTGHAQHAGHCHCVFQIDAELAVTTPAVETAVWPPHVQPAPEVDPGAIDWPPEARS